MAAILVIDRAVLCIFVSGLQDPIHNDNATFFLFPLHASVIVMTDR